MIEALLQDLSEREGVAERLGLQSGGRDVHALHISSRWEGRNVWALFRGRTRAPLAIVKADHRPRYQQRLRDEHETLTTLATRPELRGSVPEPIVLLESDGRLVLVQTGLPGIPLTVLTRQRMRYSPRASARDHHLVLSWLTRFQLDGQAGADHPLSGQHVVERVQSLVEGEHRAFVEEVSRLSGTWDKLELPLVPGHGDLGPSNCLLDDDRVAIIDWEGGVGRRTPLADLIIFLNHYGRAQPITGRKRPSDGDAFQRCFLTDDWLARLTAESYLEHLERLGLPVDAGEYLFMATLAQLAAGEAPATHAEGAALRYWRRFFLAYARDYEASSIRRLLAARDSRS